MIEYYRNQGTRLERTRWSFERARGRSWRYCVDRRPVADTRGGCRGRKAARHFAANARGDGELEVSSRLYQEDGAEFMTLTAVIPDRHGRARAQHRSPSCSRETRSLRSATGSPRHSPTISPVRGSQTFSGHCASGEQIMMGLIEALLRPPGRCTRKGRARSHIDGVSHAVFRRKPGKKRQSNAQDLQAIIVKIGRHGDLLNKLRESLLSINRVLTYHTALESKGSTESIRSKVLSRDVGALTDQATFLSNKVNFLLDATLGLINLQQNQIIKIFSVAAVVFLPPTLVASIYGMNFQHMPELKWELGYLWALGLMAGAALLPYYFFKRKGWL